MPIRELRPICPVCCCVHSIIVPPAALICLQVVKCLQCDEPFKTDIPRSGQWEMKRTGQLLFGQ
jgi:hypothetical protein